MAPAFSVGDVVVHQESRFQVTAADAHEAILIRLSGPYRYWAMLLDFDRKEIFNLGSGKVH